LAASDGLHIVGTECEYAPVYEAEHPAAVPWFKPDAVLNYIQSLSNLVLDRLVSTKLPFAGEFLGNGGRLYVDRSGHLEYATPECRSMHDLVVHEKAGERLVQQLAASVRRFPGSPGRSAGLHLFKNNVDYYGHTYGAHENYWVSPRCMQAIQQIVPFLATRQIYTGAGKVTVRAADRRMGYQVSQRADAICRTVSDRSTADRGIVNIRQREITSHAENRRLHLILGDSNMSEVALGLKVGITRLVLGLLDAGTLANIPYLDSPVEAVRRISRDIHSPLQLEGRRGYYTSLDIQNMYLERAHKHFSNRKIDGESRQMMQWWEEMLEGLALLRVSFADLKLEEDPSSLRRKLDWVLKLWLLDRYAKPGRNTRPARWYQAIDFRYHDLHQRTGLFHRCQDLDLVDRLVDDETIDNAIHHPPKKTRARIRGAIIRNTRGKSIEVCVENWERIVLRAASGASGRRHPFNHYKGDVNSLQIDLSDPLADRNTALSDRVRAFVSRWG